MVVQKKDCYLVKIAILFWRRVQDSTCPAGQAASGCKVPPAPCQVPSGSNPVDSIISKGLALRAGSSFVDLFHCFDRIPTRGQQGSRGGQCKRFVRAILQMDGYAGSPFQPLLADRSQ